MQKTCDQRDKPALGLSLWLSAATPVSSQLPMIGTNCRKIQKTKYEKQKNLKHWTTGHVNFTAMMMPFAKRGTPFCHLLV